MRLPVESSLNRLTGLGARAKRLSVHTAILKSVLCYRLEPLPLRRETKGSAFLSLYIYPLHLNMQAQRLIYRCPRGCSAHLILHPTGTRIYTKPRTLNIFHLAIVLNDRTFSPSKHPFIDQHFKHFPPFGKQAFLLWKANIPQEENEHSS